MTDTLRVFAIVSALGVGAALLIRRSDFIAARASSAAVPAPVNSGLSSTDGGMAGAVAR
jgi:hypothetical protein